MLERSSAAKFAISIFYENFNDFDVYIEDTAPGYAKIFSSILSRAMDGGVALEKVFPLGDRNVVISTARKRLQSQSNRRAVFIVDGDLYLLAGEREELPENLVVLPRYCIENFLFDEDVLVSIMDEEHCSLTAEVLARQLDYSGWLSRSREALTLIFRSFAVAHKLHAEIPTVSRGYKSICLNGSGELSLDKALAVEKEIIDALISDKGLPAVNEAISFVDSKINRDECFVTTYVSAKDFVLPLMLVRMRALLDSNSKNVSLKIRMSNKCSTGPFDGVVQSMKKILTAQKPQVANLNV